MATTSKGALRKRVVGLLTDPVVIQLATAISGDDSSALVAFVVDDHGLVIATKTGRNADHPDRDCESLFVKVNFIVPDIAVLVSGPPVPTKEMWEALQDVFAQRGVQLLDWLIHSAGDTQSLATIYGTRALP